jgi:hypothetical protein
MNSFFGGSHTFLARVPIISSRRRGLPGTPAVYADQARSYGGKLRRRAVIDGSIRTLDASGRDRGLSR